MDGAPGRDVLAYADSLHNLARYLTGSATMADRLVQETYVRAVAASRSATAAPRLKPWLFRLLRDTYLAQSRRQRHEFGDDAGGGSELDEWPRDDRELDRLSKVTGHELEQALRTLSEEARAVILLDLEGLTGAEVADVIGCPVDAVGSRLLRARAALRVLLRGLET